MLLFCIYWEMRYESKSDLYNRVSVSQAEHWYTLFSQVFDSFLKCSLIKDKWNTAVYISTAESFWQKFSKHTSHILFFEGTSALHLRVLEEETPGTAGKIQHVLFPRNASEPFASSRAAFSQE